MYKIHIKTLDVAISAAIMLAVQGCNTTSPGGKQSGEYVGAILPFQQPVNQSIAKETLAESTLAKRTVQSHLSKDAPNILIVLLMMSALELLKPLVERLKHQHSASLLMRGWFITNFIPLLFVRRQEHHY